MRPPGSFSDSVRRSSCPCAAARPRRIEAAASCVRASRRMRAIVSSEPLSDRSVCAIRRQPNSARAVYENGGSGKGRPSRRASSRSCRAATAASRSFARSISTRVSGPRLLIGSLGADDLPRGFADEGRKSQFGRRRAQRRDNAARAPGREQAFLILDALERSGGGFTATGADTGRRQPPGVKRTCPSSKNLS